MFRVTGFISVDQTHSEQSLKCFLCSIPMIFLQLSRFFFQQNAIFVLEYMLPTETFINYVLSVNVLGDILQLCAYCECAMILQLSIVLLSYQICSICFFYA